MIRYKATTKTGRSFIIDPRSPFSLKYKVGKIVKAAEGSPGIMTFKSLRSLKFFVGYHNKDYRIFKVKPIGRANKVHRISADNKTYMLRLFFKYLRDKDEDSFIGLTFNPPEGTLCYDAVKVLSEIKLEDL